jgi:TolA-binding protein
MKTIDYSYFVERYIAGEMDQTEEIWFKKELEGNESLQKELYLRRKTDLILERNDIVSLRNKLATIEMARRDEMIKNGKLHLPRFRFAAIITGLFIIGSIVFLSFKTESPEKIYKKYYQVYDNPGPSRSAEATYNEAIDYFNKGEFSNALNGFNAYLKNRPESPQIEFLSGVSYMEIKKFPEAKLSLNKVINRKTNSYIVDANWYLAMCYIATKDKVMAKSQLSSIVKSESIYKNKARKILRHL